MSTVEDAHPNDWQPKAILFDLLTALLDSWTLWDASTPSGTVEEGRRWRKRYLELTFGAGTYVPYEGLVRTAARDVGLPETADENLLRNWEHLQPWPEVTGILAQLRARKIRLGVVTNCSTELGRVAARRAWQVVEGGWDVIMTAEESGFYKPVESAYKAALSAMGVEARDVLFVAGSAGDVQGATNAGMKVVWHNRVGLAAVGNAQPLREGSTLNDALKGFL